MPFKVFSDDGILTDTDVMRYWVQQYSVVKSVDETLISNATVQSDDELIAPLLANSVYWIEIFLIYETIQTADLKVGWSVPAGASLHWCTNGQNIDSTSTVWDVLKRERSEANTEIIGGPGAALGTDAIMPGEGYVTTAGTAGNLIFQWAQGASIATTTTVRANSVLIAQRLTV